MRGVEPQKEPLIQTNTPFYKRNKIENLVRILAIIAQYCLIELLS